MSNEKKESDWERRERLMTLDLELAIQAKQEGLERSRVEFEQRQESREKAQKRDEDHMEYCKNHLDFMEKGEARNAERDKIVDASCEDQRKQLKRIADSLERLEKFFIDREG